MARVRQFDRIELHCSRIDRERAQAERFLVGNVNKACRAVSNC